MFAPFDRELRVLHVDDNPGDLKYFGDVLRGLGCVVTPVLDVKTANRLFLESFVTGKPYEVALIDMRIGPDSGVDLALRAMDIAAVNTILITGHADSLTFRADGVVVKGKDMARSARKLVREMRLLTRPKRVSIDPVDVKVNKWITTADMFGISALEFLDHDFSGVPEKRSAETITLLDKDENQITVVLEPVHCRDSSLVCRLTSTIGCDGLCLCCGFWQRTDPAGKVVRLLTKEEIVSQLYHAIVHGEKFVEMFRDNSKLELNLQFREQGDFGNNLENCIKAMVQFTGIKGLKISFLASSFGIETALQALIDEYIDVPGLSFAWSFYSPDPKIREFIVPGSKGCSIEDLADLYGILSQLTKNQVDLVVPLYTGINDGREDARKIAAFMREKERGLYFRVVLIAGSGEYVGALKGVPNTPIGKPREFRRWLNELGVKGVIIKRNPGSKKGEGTGLGHTTICSRHKNKEVFGTVEGGQSI